MGLIAIEETIRDWIADILPSNPVQIGIALRQRAKFEGWLKLDFAAQAN